MTKIRFLATMCLLSTLSSIAAFGSEKNGFFISNPLIPENQILAGGPPKDGIPAILSPKFVSAKSNTFVQPKDRILGISLGNEHKAYPIAILNWHEIVNDHVDGKAVALSYCPLCGTGVAFLATFDGKKHDFGVSGLLYNSDVLLYDKQTLSLWSQLKGQAISGPQKGKHLKRLPIRHTSWEKWLVLHPNTLVLSPDTGFSRDYHRNPYKNYDKRDGLFFPVSHHSNKRAPKEIVMGIEINGVTKAYPFLELEKIKTPFSDKVGGLSIRIDYDEKSKSGSISNEKGLEQITTTAFWFAWFTFHPDTLIFNAKNINTSE